MAFKKRYGKNPDGSYSECKARPENVGKYRCDHSEHVTMTPIEAQAANEKNIEESHIHDENSKTSLSKKSAKTTSNTKNKENPSVAFNQADMTADRSRESLVEVDSEYRKQVIELADRIAAAHNDSKEYYQKPKRWTETGLDRRKKLLDEYDRGPRQLRGSDLDLIYNKHMKDFENVYGSNDGVVACEAMTLDFIRSKHGDRWESTAIMSLDSLEAAGADVCRLQSNKIRQGREIRGAYGRPIAPSGMSWKRRWATDGQVDENAALTDPIIYKNLSRMRDFVSGQATDGAGEGLTIRGVRWELDGDAKLSSISRAYYSAGGDSGYDPDLIMVTFVGEARRQKKS